MPFHRSGLAGQGAGNSLKYVASAELQLVTIRPHCHNKRRMAVSKSGTNVIPVYITNYDHDVMSGSSPFPLSASTSGSLLS